VTVRPCNVSCSTRARARSRATAGRARPPHSFLALLRELKRRGRSFTLVFRTFGFDLGRFERELNALCEGTHPLFPPGASADGATTADGLQNPQVQIVI